MIRFFFTHFRFSRTGRRERGPTWCGGRTNRRQLWNSDLGAAWRGYVRPAGMSWVPRISCDRITMTSDATFDRGSERGGAGGAAS